MILRANGQSVKTRNAYMMHRKLNFCDIPHRMNDAEKVAAVKE